MKDSVSFDEFVQFLRRFTLTPAIIQLSRLSYHLEKTNQIIREVEFDDPGLMKRRTIISQFALAFLSSQLVISSNDFRGKNPSYNDVLLLCNWYNNLEQKRQEKPTLLDILGRISQEQLPFQEIGFYHFARGYYLIKEVSRRSGYSNSFDLNSTFLEWCGLNIEDYYWIAWCINSVGFNSDPLFNKDYFVNNSIDDLKDILTNDKLDKFLKINSADIYTIRKDHNQVNAKVPKGFEKYRFNILGRYPIVKLDSSANRFTDKDFLLVNSRLMMTKIVDGAYWGLRDFFLSKDANKQDFVNFWGEIFGKYSGEILMKYYGSDKVLCLDDIGNKLKCKIADWVVITDQEILIFECKSSLLPLNIKGVFDQNELKEWSKEHFVEGGAKQLEATERLITENKIDFGISISEKRIKKILLTYQNLYIPREWEDLIKNICFEESIIENKNWFENFYIMSIFDLELFEKLSSTISLSKILDDLRLAPAENFMTMCKKLYGEKLTNSLLESVKGKFWDKVQH